MTKADLTEFRRPAPRTARSTEVAQIVIDYLLSGRIHPGERLPSERELGEALSVGRSAIREALSALHLLGVLEVRQGGGHYLRGVTSELLPKVIHWGLLIGEKQPLDLLETRAALEVRAAYLAAQRHDAKTIKALREQFRRIRDDAKKDGTALADDDLAFHEALVRATGNAVLLEVWLSVRGLLHVWIMRVVAQQRSARNFLQEHRAVLRAIESGDPVAAAAAMSSHMDRAIVRLRDVINGAN